MLKLRKSSGLLIAFGLLFSAGLPPINVLAQSQEPPSALQQIGTQAEVSTASWFNTIRHRPTQLRAFLQRMPKGGDIHSHLSGAVYAESYIKWAADHGYCIDPDALKIIAPEDCLPAANYVPADNLFHNTSLYEDLVDHLSTRNLPFAGHSGHDQFFQTFESFGEISGDPTLKDDMVAEAANRAADQHITYLELMLTFKGSDVRRLGRELGLSDLTTTRQRLLANKQFQALLQAGLQDLETLDTERSNTLGCGTKTAQPGCNVTVRFLQQTTRFKQPAEVFAQFVYAFELAKADSRLVGINLVAPEDHPIALRDYTQQMEMLGFLKRQDSDVNISLHAGELTLGLVPPEDLKFHIRQAVEIAGASRIGHGVDIFYEDNPWQLLESMRQRGVLVEICLTSNDVILGVSGDDHPFPDYWQAGVPVTLASDDEGVARIDLSHEYWRAASDYDLDYLDLKQLVRNSLEYSFLPGKSLWESSDFSVVVKVCAGDDPHSGILSAGCREFLSTHERAREQWKLETEFASFEALTP